MKWNQLPLGGRIVLIVAPIVVLVAIIVTVFVTTSRDEEAYQYGRTERPFAVQIWRLAQSDPDSYPEVHNVEDACRVSVEADEKVKAQKFDVDDVIEGCVDAMGGGR